ncbi:hypothetical protein AB0P36_34480 [Streptomyces flavidovirens]|uniref:hypothetical protein n=1 Tax=Streptomyces flavidovirens TaxID=67298 RepID=UPI00342ADC5F
MLLVIDASSMIGSYTERFTVPRNTSKRHEGTFVPPNKVTVTEWLDQWLAMKAEDLEPTTIYNYRITLDRVRTRRLVTVNVASEVHIPLKSRKAERKMKAVVMPWNATEVGAFIAAMKGDRLYAPLLLSLMGSGQRRSVACGGRTSTWRRPRSASPTHGR